MEYWFVFPIMRY